VLVVDDDDDIREAISDALTRAGYNVRQAANGRDALTEMRGETPSLVLLDLMMPVMDGWQVIGEMAADPALVAIPVCIVSAQSGQSPPRAVARLQKPVTLEALLAAVARYGGAAND
jgi:CheY-like chemotaxis protein